MTSSAIFSLCLAFACVAAPQYADAQSASVVDKNENDFGFSKKLPLRMLCIPDSAVGFSRDKITGKWRESRWTPDKEDRFVATITNFINTGDSADQSTDTMCWDKLQSSNEWKAAAIPEFFREKARKEIASSNKCLTTSYFGSGEKFVSICKVSPGPDYGSNSFREGRGTVTLDDIALQCGDEIIIPNKMFVTTSTNFIAIRLGEVSVSKGLCTPLDVK